MQNTNATTLPIEFVRHIYADLAGRNAVEDAVNFIWPYPAGTRHVDALVAVHCNGLDMTRYQALSDALYRKAPAPTAVAPTSTTPK